MSFLVGQDNSFLERLLPVVKKYNPLPANSPDYVFKAEKIKNRKYLSSLDIKKMDSESLLNYLISVIF